MSGIAKEPQPAVCGARLPDGEKCGRAPLDGKARCRLHGGASTGPKTPEGRRRIAAAQFARWREINMALTLRRRNIQHEGAT